MNDVSGKRGNAHARLLDAAYELFVANGVNRVGIEAVLARSGCAKASLYNNFRSKHELALAVLDRHQRSWARQWLQAEVLRRSADPRGRLLAVFDAFDDWFARDDFEGCPFIRLLLESPHGEVVRVAAARHLASMREFLERLATDAGLAEPGRFAGAWHMLMNGAILAACEGDRGAARTAGEAGVLLLSRWPRRWGAPPPENPPGSGASGGFSGS